MVLEKALKVFKKGNNMARRTTKIENAEKEVKAAETEKDVKAVVAKKTGTKPAKRAVSTKIGQEIDQLSNMNSDPDLETKEDKFHRIAPARVSKVLDSLRILGHCSNLSIYEYSEEEVDKMFSSIKRKLDAVEHNFREKLEYNQEVDFKF